MASYSLNRVPIFLFKYIGNLLTEVISLLFINEPDVPEYVQKCEDRFIIVLFSYNDSNEF